MQDFDLEVNTNGSKEYVTNIRPFTNVNTLILFFPDNHGDVDKTVIQYIGLQGEHTHYRREPVDAVYEVLCNGQDTNVKQEDMDAAHAHSHGHTQGHSHLHDHSH